LKGAKALGLVIAALQVAGLVLFAVSFHTLYTVMSSAFSGDAFTYTATMDEATGSLALRLEGGLRNDGFIGADLSLEAAVLNLDEEYIARNSTAVHLDAGAQRSVTLILRIPAGKVQQAGLEGGGLFEITFRIRTLEGLVGFTNTMRIRGGGEE